MASHGRVLVGLPLWAMQRGARHAALRSVEASPGIFKQVSRSQSGEEDFLWNNFFFGTSNGTFIEMGALDGEKFSNTLGLEMLLGWRGVLIEASPSSYSRLQERRKNQLVINAAVCDAIRQVHYLEGGATGGIVEFMPPTFIKRWHPSYDAKQLSHLQAVPCVPLDLLLEPYGLTHFNFFSLDVEGGELQVLRAINFSAISFDVIVVEADGDNRTKDDAVTGLLADAGYDLYKHFKRNNWYARHDFVPRASDRGQARQH